MVQVIAKVVTYKHTELTIDNKNGRWSIGDAINKQITEALEQDQQLAEAKVEFTDDEWFAMRRAFHQQQMPDAYERSQGIGTATTTNSVPVVEPNASSLPTTNKKPKWPSDKATATKAVQYYLFDLAAHEHYGPFYTQSAAHEFGKRKPIPSYQILHETDVLTSDKQMAISPNK